MNEEKEEEQEELRRPISREQKEAGNVKKYEEQGNVWR